MDHNFMKNTAFLIFFFFRFTGQDPTLAIRSGRDTLRTGGITTARDSV